MSNDKNEDKADDSKPEIRYVPLDVRTIENEDETINVFEIFNRVWDGREKIFKAVIIFAVIGLFVAVVSVKEYTSDVKVIPETEQGFSLGALGGLAQQFGLSAPSRQTSEGISADLYPAIIQSNVFINELMGYQVPVPGTDRLIPLKEYFKEYQKNSLIKSLVKYTVLLPITLKNWLKDDMNEITTMDRELSDQAKLNRLMRMTKREWKILQNIRDRISTSMNTENGVVTVSVQMQDPILAADLADEVVQMLSKYITEKRTEKARRDVKFIETRYEEAKSRFEKAQRELATFHDENRGQLTAMARTEEQLLQSRYDLSFNLYDSMAKRLEEANIKLQEETPVINILEPAAVPYKSSEPNLIILMIAFIVIGFTIGLGSIFLSPFLNRLRSENK